jgi:hypothetical protein
MSSTIRQAEIIRGKLLYYLSLIYPQAATLPLLQGELDIFGYPVPTDELTRLVAYLSEKNLVSIEKVRGPIAQRFINLVKITARGIDYLEGRLPTDEGIYLEPRL